MPAQMLPLWPGKMIPSYQNYTHTKLLLEIRLMSFSIHPVGFLVGIALLKRHHHEDVTRMCYAEITSILLMEEIRLTTWDI